MCRIANTLTVTDTLLSLIAEHGCMHDGNSSAHLPKQCQERSQLILFAHELTNTSRIWVVCFVFLSKSIYRYDPLYLHVRMIRVTQATTVVSFAKSSDWK